MSKVNGVDPGDFPSRPGNWPSRNLGQPTPGKRTGCPPRAAAILLIFAGVPWGLVELVRALAS